MNLSGLNVTVEDNKWELAFPISEKRPNKVKGD